MNEEKQWEEEQDYKFAKKLSFDLKKQLRKV